MTKMKLNNILVGLVGKKQSGKDTVAGVLHRLSPFGLNYQRIAFADEIKLELANLTGGNVQHIESHKEEVRPLLQFWGTEYRRKICGEDYWIKKVKLRLDKISTPALVIFTDVRFQNEAAYIKELEGFLVRVERPVPSCLNTPDLHSSETEQDKIECDWTLRNHQTIRYLEFEVKILTEQLKEKYNNL